MTNEWQEVTLSAIADLSGGFAFKSEDYGPSGRFILRTLNIRDDCSISRDDAVYLPEELCAQYARFELKPHDTLFVMVGATLGKVGYVRKKDLPALLNQNMWVVRAKQDIADPRFVHYAFRRAVKASLGWASGSAREFVRRDDYRNLQVLVPPLPEQRAIAHILGTLDDKIELNRRMNETLEAMARAMFKSWFVDFDPVRAKAEGRLPAPRPNTYYVYVIECENGSHYIGQTDDLQRRWEEHKEGKVEWTKRHKPVRIAHYEEFSTREEAVKRESDVKSGFGRKWLKKLIASGRARQAGQPFGMDTTTAVLFPDSFQDSPLGKIPKGWIVGTVGESFKITMGQSPPGETYNELGEGLPFFQGRKDFGLRYPVRRVFCTAPTRIANPGDTLVSVRAPVGEINMAAEKCCVGRGVAAIRHKSGSRSLTYYAMQSLASDFARFEAEGTVFGSINKKGFQDLPWIVPPPDLVAAFEKVAYALDQKVEVNEAESATLAAIRDALLPRLISGEIRVRDAEKFIEAKL